MSDNEIRQILAEKKRKQRRAERKAEIIAEVIEGIGTLLAWAGLLWIGFMLSVIGG